MVLRFTIHHSRFTAVPRSPLTLARRPRHPFTSTDKINRVFGIEMPDWEDQLRWFLLGFIRTKMTENGALTPRATVGSIYNVDSTGDCDAYQNAEMGKQLCGAAP
jgi:hypothetical protein